MENIGWDGNWMKLLKEIIRKQGINFDEKTIYREAVRGV